MVRQPDSAELVLKYAEGLSDWLTPEPTASGLTEDKYTLEAPAALAFRAPPDKDL